jgi:DNA-directed RNA polymerase subunit M/transcription elongation factor TFIIS
MPPRKKKKLLAREQPPQPTRIAAASRDNMTVLLHDSAVADPEACEQLLAQNSLDDDDYVDNTLRMLLVAQSSGCAADAALARETLHLSDAEYMHTLHAGGAHLVRAQERTTRLAQLDQIAEGCTAGALRCRRCGNDRIAVQQKQTRSADEGMTIFCSCDTCGQQWRMS